MLDFPPILFMAIARVVWASREMLPKDMAPVANLLTIFAAGSTCNITITITTIITITITPITTLLSIK